MYLSIYFTFHVSMGSDFGHIHIIFSLPLPLLPSSERRPSPEAHVAPLSSAQAEALIKEWQRAKVRGLTLGDRFPPSPLRPSGRSQCRHFFPNSKHTILYIMYMITHFIIVNILLLYIYYIVLYYTCYTCCIDRFTPPSLPRPWPSAPSTTHRPSPLPSPSRYSLHGRPEPRRPGGQGGSGNTSCTKSRQGSGGVRAAGTCSYNIADIGLT